MRGQAGDQANIAGKKKRLMQTGFRLFSENGIEAVSMSEIADASGIARASIYRYFPTKLDLVVATSAWMWDGLIQERLSTVYAGKDTGAQVFAAFLDSFLQMYRDHRDILRFNQFFNVYVAREGTPPEQLRPFQEVIQYVARQFHDTYEMGRRDGTLRTDIPENEMFSSALHLMLAGVTRYAVGLVYDGGNAPERELTLLKEMLLRQYATEPI